MGKSLAKLLETVSPSKAKWSVVTGQPNHYKVDLGLGNPIMVGSSNELWAGKATIDKAAFVKALNAKLAADPAFSVEKFFGEKAKPAPAPAGGAAPGKAPPNAPNVPNVPKGGPPVKPAQLKEADINENRAKYLQNLLKDEMKAADTNWDKWNRVQ